MKTTGRADYRIESQLGWRMPEEFIAVVDIEDDESSAFTNYEQIQVDEFVEVATQIFFGIVKAEYVNQDWYIQTLEMVEDITEKDWTLDEIKDAIREWVENVNTDLENAGMSGFEDRQSGDYWEGEY